MNFEQFMNVLDIKEEYQIQPKLMEVLLSDRKNVLLDQLIANGFDTSKDELREIFENELANRKTLKQDYTPDCLCELISKLCGGQKEILDVCCGVGSLSLKNANTEHFVMEEISDVSIALVLLNMCIRNMNADIYKKDVLTREVTTHYVLTRSDRFSDIEIVHDQEDLDRKYNCIISNPPYSLKWEPLNDERFFSYGLAPKSKADYAFILDVLYRLEENGKAFVILPHGVLFRGQAEGEIRKAMLHDNVIDCIIGIPGDLFFNTQIPTIILCLNKNKTDNDVLFIDGSKECHKEGKFNVMNDENINKILDTYHNRKTVDKFSKLVSFEEIKENDYNLNIPRYVDTSEPKEPVDIMKNLRDLIKIEEEIRNTEMELARMLKQLTGPDEYIQYRNNLVQICEDSKGTHSYSNMCVIVNNWIDRSKQKLSVQKEVSIYDVADFERSKKNKEYDEGCVLIQVSATKGQLVYLDKKRTVDSKYGVFIPKKINGKYLYYILEMIIPDFLGRYQTGLNINPEIFKYLKFLIHPDIQTQETIVYILDSMKIGVDISNREIEAWKNTKQYHLDNMFI